MEALVGEVGRSHADVALELEGRKQREVSREGGGASLVCKVSGSLPVGFVSDGLGRRRVPSIKERRALAAMAA